MSDMIELKNISKTYVVRKRGSGVKDTIQAFFKPEHTKIRALRDISFTIDTGEIVGYIGPNGAGKSTTIKIMCGILTPDENEQSTCIIDGYVPWKQRVSYVRQIGVVFGQRSQLWWDVPVMDSFELLKDIYKIPDTDYQKTKSMLIELLHLQEIVKTPVRQLSLGQRMRCEFAASLLHSPSILFLDEPTIGLDAISKIAVRQFIKQINQEKKVTVILTTHDMHDIEVLTNRIILIGQGTLLHYGSWDYIKERDTPDDADGAQALEQAVANMYRAME